MAHMLATYIALPGTTAEAMTHWHEVFGGDLEIITYAQAGMTDLPFDPPPAAVAHASLTLPAGIITGGDVMNTGGDYPIKGTAYSLLYTTDTPEEAEHYIRLLLGGGGSIGMPFEHAPWGDWYGQVFDRYGVMWAFSCTSV